MGVFQGQMRVAVSGLFSRVSKNFRAVLGSTDVLTSDGAQAETNGIETRLHRLTRGDDTHVLAHAEDREADRRWCKVGVRIILPSQGAPEIQSSFGIDAIDFALEEDFAPQSNVLEIAIELIAQHLPDLDTGDILRDQLDQSFSRVRECWSDNEAKGFTLDQFSAYKDYRWKLVLGAPSTALGSSQMIGVEFSEYQKGFNTGYRLNTKKTEPINQEVLAGMAYLSGHEKLQILQGEPTEALRSARAVFEEARTRGCRWQFHTQARPSRAHLSNHLHDCGPQSTPADRMGRRQGRSGVSRWLRVERQVPVD